jgi:hypothetical protein
LAGALLNKQRLNRRQGESLLEGLHSLRQLYLGCQKSRSCRKKQSHLKKLFAVKVKVEKVNQSGIAKSVEERLDLAVF